MQLLRCRLHVQTLRSRPKVVLQLVLRTQRRQIVRRVVVVLAPWPNVHLLAKVLDHLLDRVVVVVATTATATRTRHAAIATRATALLRGRRCSIRTVPAQALHKARVVKAGSTAHMVRIRRVMALVVVLAVAGRRVLVHRVGGVRFKDRTAVPVRQQRRQCVLVIRARVRKVLVVRLVLVNVVQVVRKVLVRRWRAGRVARVVQRATTHLKGKWVRD